MATIKKNIYKEIYYKTLSLKEAKVISLFEILTVNMFPYHIYDIEK